MNIGSPDSFMFFIKFVVKAFKSFLLILAGEVLVNALARKKHVSDLTHGFLLFIASRISSRLASKVV